MSHAIIGWEGTEPPGDRRFNAYLHAQGEHLYFEGLNLFELIESGVDGWPLGSPLEIAYLPKIREKIRAMSEVFERARAALNYEGCFYYAYASKANAAEEVTRTAVGAGAHFEMSSGVDVDIARYLLARGYLKPEHKVICNGFKGPDFLYAEKIVALKREHDNVIPVLEDLSELDAFADSGLPFEVGLRQKIDKHVHTVADVDRSHIRFGMKTEDLFEAARRIEGDPNLTLTLYHAMVGSQIVDRVAFVERLSAALEIYARLKEQHPSLDIFDFGGGTPVGMTLDFDFDYEAFARELLSAAQSICVSHNVPVPHVMGEFGRYTVAEHGAHLFKVITAKDNGSRLPWYIINGSIMTSFPDIWAIGERFIVLPLNHLDKPFRQVLLGGVTCDSDDVYPFPTSPAVLYLPTETENLHIGFFGIGAYQEMLGGVRGAKHCVLPEAVELVIDRDEAGDYQFTVLKEQSPEDVLRILGYGGDS
jgi:arginine decarboxylase